jgi:hypothetical protein
VTKDFEHKTLPIIYKNNTVFIMIYPCLQKE